MTGPVLTPQQAISYLDEMLQKRPEIAALSIAGPGDPFANPEETLETLNLARSKYPGLLFSLFTNGLDVVPYLDELVKLKVTHISVAVNTFDPRTGGRLYAWVRDHKTRAPLQGLRGAGLLIEHQREAIRKLKEKKVIVHINTIIVPDINDAQIPALAKELGELGVDSMNCIPMIAVKGALFEDLTEPDQFMMARVRLQAGEHVGRLSDCGGCHAKAFVAPEISDQEQGALLREYAQKGADQRARPCIAVATSDGATVNQPLGEAPRFLLFAPDPKAWSGFSFQEMRIAPKTGSGVEHWKALAEILYDCHSILVSAAGIGPRAVLDELGIRVVEMKQGPVAEGLAALFAGKPIPEELQCATSGCSSGGCGGGRGRRSGACYN